ncbi:hypothetical protein GS860_05275, partial [Rhodococcus hoagii]|nr:hypothetical protein [Prescottella equi]
ASVERWTVRFFQAVADGSAEELVSVEHEWLVDAFDRAIAELDRTGNRIEADMELGRAEPPSEV